VRSKYIQAVLREKRKRDRAKRRRRRRRREVISFRNEKYN